MHGTRRPGSLARARIALALAALAGVVVGPALAGAAEITALPRGGTSILPEHRVVALFGAPQSPALGALGIGTPAQAARRLERQAAPYARLAARPVLPAMELIATIATAEPGADGLYPSRQPASVVRRYLAAARRARALLILDVQPGRAGILAEARALAPFLRHPHVGLAIDPEWAMGPGQVPGATIGSVDADEVNRVSDWLAALVRRQRLPEKLLVVHQFTDAMIGRRARLRSRPGVELVVTADGVGAPAQKVATYRRVSRARGSWASGFKLFYEEDAGLMSPRAVLGLRPRPDLVIYE